MNITEYVIMGQTSLNCTSAVRPSWILHDVNLGNNPESNELRTLYTVQNLSFLISPAVGKLDFWGFWLAEISLLSGRSPPVSKFSLVTQCESSGSTIRSADVLLLHTGELRGVYNGKFEEI